MDSSKSMVPMTSERWPGPRRTASCTRPLGPAVERVGARRSCARPCRRGRPGRSSSRAARPSGTASRPTGCCRSGSSASCRSRSAGRRTPGCAGRSPRSRRPAPGRPATSARSRGRRRRRRTSAGRSSRRRPRFRSTGRPPAPEVASTRTSESSSAPAGDDRRHHGGRGLVVRPGVDVDALLGDGLGQRAGVAGDHGRGRRATARRGGLGELRGELTEGQVLALLSDQAERRDVPEGGGAAVAEHHLVAVGEAKNGSRGPRGRGRRCSSRGPGGGRCPSGRCRSRRARRGGWSGLRGAGAERPSAGMMSWGSGWRRSRATFRGGSGGGCLTTLSENVPVSHTTPRMTRNPCAPRLATCGWSRSIGHPDAMLLVEEVQAGVRRPLRRPRRDAGRPAMFDPPQGSFLVGYSTATRWPPAPGAAVPTSRRSAPPRTAEIKRMYVAPAARGRGLARAMLAQLEETARAAGAEAMVLETGIRSRRRSRSTSRPATRRSPGSATTATRRSTDASARLDFRRVQPTRR